MRLVGYTQTVSNIRYVRFASITTVSRFLSCIVSDTITLVVAETVSDVPASVLKLRGMADILFGENAEAGADTIGDEFEPNVKDLTSRILERATFHQSQASKPRLHNTVRTAGSISGSSTSSLGFKNLNKAQKVVADRKKKTEEAKLTEAGIRIAATLWILDNSLKSRKAPSQVRPHTLSFPPEIRI